MDKMKIIQYVCFGAGVGNLILFFIWLSNNGWGGILNLISGILFLISGILLIISGIEILLIISGYYVINDVTNARKKAKILLILSILSGLIICFLQLFTDSSLLLNFFIFCALPQISITIALDRFDKPLSSTNEPEKVKIAKPELVQRAYSEHNQDDGSLTEKNISLQEKAKKQTVSLLNQPLPVTSKSEKQALTRTEQITSIQKNAQQLLGDAEKIGAIPDSIKQNILADDAELLKNAINDLEKLNAAAKPELTITLAETRLIIDKWHKVELRINNTGDAHASDIQLVFSDDFETRWVAAVSVKAKESVTLNIGIKPKTEGNIPIEITSSYKDGRNKDYQQVFKFWIDVAGKTGLDSGKTPSQSPVSAFTPKPLTLKHLPPDLADRYTESEFIGKGGFARVFKAKRKDGKYVAVKIPISMDAATGKSFIAEMQNWTKLSHPNIVRLYDFNIMPMPYFEEELCDSALADQNKPIESEEAAWILFNICEGLKFAHAQKIIHRDLKPQNILLKNGVPKISDWGLSRIVSESTSTTVTSFTPYYAAPEQINNRTKDERTDIWQIGVILYELVTGVLPFKGDSMIEIGMSIATKDPIPPSELKPDAKVIDSVVMKCLEKDPKKRYQSVLELQKDLGIYLRKNYAELLKTSVTVKDYNRSAYYCGDLVMINLLTGDIPTAYKYLLDLVAYSKGDMKAEAQELSEQIKMRMEMGITEIPDELVQKADIIVHKVSIGFRNRE